jgi:hypothetical protein
VLATSASPNTLALGLISRGSGFLSVVPIVSGLSALPGLDPASARWRAVRWLTTSGEIREIAHRRKIDLGTNAAICRLCRATPNLFGAIIHHDEDCRGEMRDIQFAPIKGK